MAQWSRRLSRGARHRESRQRYHRVLAEAEANGGKLSAPAAARPAVAHLVLAYRRHAKTRYSQAELYNVRIALNCVRELYGRSPADEFGLLALQAVRRRMVDIGGWARPTVNKRTKIIVRAFNWGVSQQVVPPGVWDALRSVSGLRVGELGVREGRTVMPASRASVRRMRRHASRDVRVLVLLGLLTAARPGELVALRRGDIDLQGSIWYADLARHKTPHHGKRRRLHFGPRAQRLLAPLLHKHNDEAPLFSYGATAAYRRAITRACKRAGVLPFHPNQLRHSAATRIRREHGLEAAQLVLGHSSAVITDTTYALRDDRTVREVMSRIG